MQKVFDTLSDGKMAHVLLDEFSESDLKLIKPYNLLTIKPLIYAMNISQESLHDGKNIAAEFEKKLEKPVAIVCAKVESELMELEGEEKKEFFAELLELENIDHVPTLDDLIALAFKTVGLMYYFTTGEKETRAWTIPIGSTAPQAAGAIHTDFER